MKVKGLILQALKFGLFLLFSPIILPFMLLGSIIRDFRKRGKKSLIVKLTFVFFIISTIWLFIFSTPQTDGSSMEPDLHNGEYVILNKIDYKFKTPAKEATLLYIKIPQKDNYPDYMGKIIAISGEILQIKEGDVYLNGALLHEPYATGATMPSGEEGEIKEGVGIENPHRYGFCFNEQSPTRY